MRIAPLRIFIRRAVVDDVAVENGGHETGVVVGRNRHSDAGSRKRVGRAAVRQIGGYN